MTCHTYRTLRPDVDEQFAVHPYTPAMQYRLDHPEATIPIVAVRSTKCPRWMQLFYDVRGSVFWLPEKFGNPLPGTGRGGVCVLYTDEPIVVQEDPRIVPVAFDTGPGTSKERTLEAIIRHYAAILPPVPAGRG